MWQPLILLLIVSKSWGDNNVILKSVDFIDSIPMSAKITAYVCWDRDDRTSLWKSLSKNYRINFTKKLTQQKIHTNHLFVVDLNCDGFLNILKDAEKARMFKPPAKWLLLGDVSQVSGFYFGIDSQVFVLDAKSGGITEVYKCSDNGREIRSVVSKYGDFSVSNRSDLMGETVKVSFVITNPDSLNHLEDYRNPHIDGISKVNYFLVNHLLDYLNASRSFIMQTSWGYKNATTGLYSGMVGDLQQGFAHLGGTPLFFTADRTPVIEYFAATTRTYIKFIFRAPPLSYVTNVFTLPFDSSVWHYCFVMVAIVVVCIYMIVFWEWKNVKFREKVLEKQPDTLRANFFDVVMMGIGAITQQGTNVEPKSIAGRIITIFTFTTLMFLYTSYSANIVALLQSTSNSIRTLDDLLNSRIQLGVEDIVYAHYYFENAKEPVRKAIYQQKVAPKGQKPNFMKAEDGIRRVQTGFFAFHTELHTGYKIISDMFQEGEKCSLKEIAYENFIEPWLAMQKNSSYKEIMKIGMRKMHEYGIQNREVRKIYSRKPQCNAGGSNFGSVGLIDCYFAFLVFGSGIAFALFLLVTETVLKKCLTRSD